jgi:RNA polymerase-binding transcription factor DksA
MPATTSDAEIRQALLERRSKLARRVTRIETDVRHQEAPLDPDSEEQVVQLENDPVLGALDASGRRELEEIDAALSRLDEGRYGACVRCGQAIDVGRLRVLPAAAHCARCAA